MGYKPYCSKGTRRCSVSKLCVSKRSTSRKERCPKGTRKCANSKCYQLKKSVKSRSRFNRKYK